MIKTVLTLFISKSLGTVSCSTTNPCHNDGTCQQVSGVKTCICMNGYEGPLCETSKSLQGTLILITFL